MSSAGPPQLPSFKMSEKQQEKEKTHHWSKDSKAKEAAETQDYDIWEDYDVDVVYKWLYEAKTRIPNKTNTKGGRLHKLINTMYNSCDYAIQEIDRNPDAAASIANATKDNVKQEIYRSYLAPLAQKVLDVLEEEEARNQYSDDDDDDSYF